MWTPQCEAQVRWRFLTDKVFHRARRVWRGVALVTATKAETLVRRAQALLELAVQIVRLGR